MVQYGPYDGGAGRPWEWTEGEEKRTHMHAGHKSKTNQLTGSKRDKSITRMPLSGPSVDVTGDAGAAAA